MLSASSSGIFCGCCVTRNTALARVLVPCHAAGGVAPIGMIASFLMSSSSPFMCVIHRDGAVATCSSKTPAACVTGYDPRTTRSSSPRCASVFIAAFIGPASSAKASPSSPHRIEGQRARREQPASPHRTGGPRARRQQPAAPHRTAGGPRDH